MNNQLALTVTAQIPGLCHVYILATRKGCMSGRSVCAQLSPWLFNVTRPVTDLRADRWPRRDVWHRRRVASFRLERSVRTNTQRGLSHIMQR